MYGHVFQQMGLLPEGFTTVLAPKRLLAGMGAQVHLDVGLVQEAPVAYLTMVHHLLALVALAAAASWGAVPLLPAAPQQPLQYNM